MIPRVPPGLLAVVSAWCLQAAARRPARRERLVEPAGSPTPPRVSFRPFATWTDQQEMSGFDVERRERHRAPPRAATDKHKYSFPSIIEASVRRFDAAVASPPSPRSARPTSRSPIRTTTPDRSLHAAGQPDPQRGRAARRRIAVSKGSTYERTLRSTPKAFASTTRTCPRSRRWRPGGTPQ